jgi:hypothetical protein
MIEGLIIRTHQLDILSSLQKTYKQAYQQIFNFYLKK